MSDTPSPAPESAPKPKLTLTPKVAAPAPASSEGAIPPVASPAIQAGASDSTSTPPSIAAAAARSAGAKPSLKLQGAVHPATPTTDAPVFQSPMPAATDDSPSIVIVALSFIAAAAALAFAYLLYVKAQ